MISDFDVVLEGAGRLHWGRNEEGVAMESSHEEIMVLASGLILFRLEDGSVNTTHVALVAAHIPEPRWTVLDVPAREPESPPPACERCQDDPTKVAKMHPPVCPGCGRLP